MENKKLTLRHLFKMIQKKPNRAERKRVIRYQVKIDTEESKRKEKK